MNVTAYEGNQPYIFISYAHKDTDTVLPIIESLTASGFRVWYDAGIEKGTHWNDNIAAHLDNCTIFIPFVSKAFCESKFCQMELHRAFEKDKHPIPIYLENVDLSSVSQGNDMWISQFQKIFFYETPWEEFIKSLVANPFLAPCTGDAKVVITEPPKTTPALSPLLKRAFMLLKECNFKQADEYFDKVLESDPESGEAYLGKLMTEMKLTSDIELKHIRYLDENSFFQKALQYCSKVRKEQLLQYANEGNKPYRIKNGKLYDVDKRITECVIPDSVTSIGERAFEGCGSLTSVTIPDSVTSIGERAFKDCNSLAGSFYAGCRYLGNKQNPYLLFMGTGGINGAKYEIHTQTKIIYSSSFSGCSKLKRITIPEGVISIGASAFKGCVSLKRITIPDSVTSIGNGAFEGCDKLKYTINSDGKFLGNEKNPYVVFMGAEYKKRNYVKCEIQTKAKIIYDYAFSCCSSLTSVTIPDGVTSIGYGAFRNCTSLTSITIPDSVTSIDEKAFDGCGSLTSVTIPDSVTSIGYGAFEKCTSLTSITIPDSVTSIGERAFFGCNSLTGVTIPNSVTSIGEDAFYGCTRLKSITIPNSVTRIDAGAFGFCNNLTIYCEAESKPKEWHYIYYHWNPDNRPVVWGYKGE